MRFLLLLFLGISLTNSSTEAATKSKKSKKTVAVSREEKPTTKSKKKNKKQKRDEPEKAEKGAAKKEPEIKEVKNEVVAEAPRESLPKASPKVDVRLGATLIQEIIEATRDPITSRMAIQSEGLSIAVIYTKPAKDSRWSYIYGGDYNLGFIKGSSVDGAVTDNLKNQHWFAFGARAGAMYRTSHNTSVGFELPIFYRMISWQFSDEFFKMDKESSFSAGVGLTYEHHFSPKANLYMSMTHQHMWGATVWTVAYQRKFW